MTRKRVKRVEPAGEDIFAALERHGSHNFQVPPPAADESPRQKAGENDISALLTRIDRLQTDLTDMQRRSYMAPAAPQAQPQQQQRGVRASEVQLDLTNLPDPAMDMPGYNRALQERINAVISARTTAARDDAIANRQAAESEGQAGIRLMTGFLSAHPEWAGKEDLIDMVSRRVVDKESAKGVSVDRYVLGDPTLFYADVAAALQKDYGALVADDGEDDDEPEQAPAARRPPTPEPLDDSGRTAGIMGGQESGGQPAKGRSTKENPNDMIADLQALQLKSGYY